jgi:serine/threonine-protein kinase HipA
MTALDVYFHADRVGLLERLPQAKLRFAYEPQWVADGGAPLSLSLPLREEPFVDEECRPFFAGLLPEGDFLRAIARAFHVSVENPFSVLEEIGGECAGAVSLAPPGAEPPFLNARPPRWLSNDELLLLLEELPSRPLLGGLEGDEEGVRLSLAGARDKLPVLWEEERVGITRGQPPSTHIVKKPIPSLPEMVANEAYCLALASESGLTAAEATPLAAGDREGLLVKRYDRLSGNGVRRIHQEDFCQALGRLPEEKYESDGGPGVSACASILRRHSAAPAVDLLAFLDALLFNLLIGNTDAHAKNYSLILEGDGSPRFAPLYDLLSASVYGPPYGRMLAMKYGGEYRPRRIRGRHLDRLAGDLEISPRTVRSHATDMVDRVLSSRSVARLGLPSPWQDVELIDGIDKVVAETAEALERAADETT